MTNLVAIVSFWCACSHCTPRPVQPTAAGVVPQRYVTVAGPRAVPLGARVYIEGIGMRRVEDRTALRFDGRWDVYVGSDKSAHQRAKSLGVQIRTVTIK